MEIVFIWIRLRVLSLLKYVIEIKFNILSRGYTDQKESRRFFTSEISPLYFLY